MKIEELQIQLDEAKNAFIEAQQQMNCIRQQIAELLCPLNIGDKVAIVDREMEYRGIVEYVNPALCVEEYFEPIIGSETGWTAGGHRIKKTTGIIGLWTFDINSFKTTFVMGKWVKSPGEFDIKSNLN